MGDYYNIEINIGGQCGKEKLRALVRKAIREDFFMGWEDGMDQEQFVEAIQEAVKEDPEVAIQLTGLQSRYTELRNMLEWLRDKGLFYQANIAGAGEMDSQRFLWLPGLDEELTWSQLDHDGHEVRISLESLRNMREQGHSIDYVIAHLHRFDQEAPKFEIVETPLVVVK